MKNLGKIHLRTIEEGLSESEMKFVTGGYGYGYGGGDVLFSCIHEYSGDNEVLIRETSCFMSLNMAIAFCSFYAALNYACRCFPC
jgi:natural product precursor